MSSKRFEKNWDVDAGRIEGALASILGLGFKEQNRNLEDGVPSHVTSSPINPSPNEECLAIPLTL